MTLERAVAFAPASVANVAIGFDILGFAVDALGDRITVTRTAQPGVRIASTTGVATDLPTDPERNTAGRALLALNVAAKPDFGFELQIEKGIPLGSGLGGGRGGRRECAIGAPVHQARTFEVRHAGRGGGERLDARR